MSKTIESLVLTGSLLLSSLGWADNAASPSAEQNKKKDETQETHEVGITQDVEPAPTEGKVRRVPPPDRKPPQQVVGTVQAPGTDKTPIAVGKSPRPEPVGKHKPSADKKRPPRAPKKVGIQSRTQPSDKQPKPAGEGKATYGDAPTP